TDLDDPIVLPLLDRLAPRQREQAGRLVGGRGEDEAHAGTVSRPREPVTPRRAAVVRPGGAAAGLGESRPRREKRARRSGRDDAGTWPRGARVWIGGPSLFGRPVPRAEAP